MSSDKLLQEAARKRFESRSNILIAESLDEIRTMLNAVASQLPQEVITSILPNATKLFFDGGDSREALYYKAKVYEEIQSKFRGSYDKPPAPDFIVGDKKVLIGYPTFLAKAKQRLSLSSKITIGLEATKRIPRAMPNSSTSLRTSTIQPGSSFTPSIITTPGLLNAPTSVLGRSLFDSNPNEYFEEIKQIGTAVLEVFWSVTLNRRGALAHPQLDKIELKSVSWET